MIKILFLAANPHDTAPLRLGEEVRAIQEKLRASEYREHYSLVQEWAVRVSDIQGHLLLHKPHIVHFSGHGSLAGEIVLEDETGASQPVPITSLKKLFSILKDNIRCVVLNACFSEAQAQAIGEAVDCVVGMSSSVNDKTSISFATAFYQALGFGRSIQTAYELACLEIEMLRLKQEDIPKLITQPNIEASTVFLATAALNRSSPTTQESRKEKKFILKKLEGIHELIEKYFYSLFCIMQQSELNELEDIASKIIPPHLMPERPEIGTEVDSEDKLKALVGFYAPELNKDLEELEKLGGDFCEMMVRYEACRALDMLEEPSAVGKAPNKKMLTDQLEKVSESCEKMKRKVITLSKNYN